MVSKLIRQVTIAAYSRITGVNYINNNGKCSGRKTNRLENLIIGSRQYRVTDIQHNCSTWGGEEAAGG
jgi:hypothetical protein